MHVQKVNDQLSVCTAECKNQSESLMWVYASKVHVCLSE